MSSAISSILSFIRARSFLRQLLNTLLALMALTWAAGAYLVVTRPDALLKLVQIEHIDVGASARISVGIDHELSSILAQTGADRASLNKFHNGKTDLAGIHFLFSSRVNELAVRGAAPVQLLNQNIPLSLLSDITPKLLAHECALVRVEHSSARDWYRQQGVSVSIACPVFHGADLIAFEQLDWVSTAYDSAVPYEMALKASAARLEGILSAE